MFGPTASLTGRSTAPGELLTKQDRAPIFLMIPPTLTGYCGRRTAGGRRCYQARRAEACDGAADAPTLRTAPRTWRACSGAEPLLGKVGVSRERVQAVHALRLCVGALVVCEPDDATRASTAAALSYSCRGTWSNCNAGGMRAIAKLLTDPALKAACDEERAKLAALLRARVTAFNALAKARGIRYPRYEGGFFVTVFHDDAQKKAAELREKGIYVVPTGKGLRIGLCSVAEADVPRLVDALA
jgi:aromatic-amino-acid transaminase